jgi:hypothetical protein
MGTIVFNGRTYGSVDEMPPAERQAYEQLFKIFADENQNGIPDFLEGDVVNNVFNALSSTVHYNGQAYNGINDLPPEARQKIEQAFGKLQSLGILPAISQTTASTQTPQSFEPAFKPSKPLLSQEPVHTEVSSSGTFIFIALGLFMACAIAGVVFLLMR